MSRALAELLLKDKIINQAQFAEADALAKGGKSYIRALIEKKYLAETKLLYYLSQKFGLPSINLAKFDVSPEVIRVMSPDLAKRSHAIPIQMNKGTLVVAICDPVDTNAIETLRFTLKMSVEPVLTSVSAFDAAMQKYYSGAAAAEAAIETFKKQSSENKEETQNVEMVQVHDIESNSNANDAPVIAMVNGLLSEGIRRNASDIHVEPYEKRFRVRMRIDGAMQEITQVPIELKRALVARIKIMSRMDIGETRVPQDGRIKLRYGGRDVDFRVNAMPTLFGEKIVLRMLAQGNLQLDLMKLGFEAGQLEVFKKGISAPNGMVLVTGPTGSGKTTTLYSALSELNKVTDNISTAEDPVEYNLEGVNQVQIQKEIGLTFANVLRSLLRQDPDIILVGEIRDYETAEVAIQAALTGHLVLSTLHTNDAPSTIVRLINMGIEPFLVVASLNTVVAQRLLRTICPKCKIDAPVPKAKAAELFQASGLPPEYADRAKFARGKGCSFCSNLGYKGRVAIYEVLDFTPALKEMVLRGDSAIEFRKQAIKDGMRTLRMSAIAKASEGVTTIEEALSLTMES
ncbi:MAG: type IV-A pilus assembly ATPase PilB [Oligoflexia bacterium]|nr:type IV-A pilus assembly ATPase PilB [Oligoflexia bacterium]